METRHDNPHPITESPKEERKAEGARLPSNSSTLPLHSVIFSPGCKSPLFASPEGKPCSLHRVASALAFPPLQIRGGREETVGKAGWDGFPNGQPLGPGPFDRSLLAEAGGAEACTAFPWAEEPLLQLGRPRRPEGFHVRHEGQTPEKEGHENALANQDRSSIT